MNMKTKVYTLLGLIVFLSFLLRFYAVINDPPALYIDEVAIGYNAYSINQTGKDEWGVSYPLLFKSFGDYKPPLYIYSVALSERLFGLNELAIRLPSMVSGVLTTLFVYLLVSELLQQNAWQNNKKIALLAALIFTICPWTLQFNRAGFEASMALFFVVAGSYFFLRALRNVYYLFPSLILFSAATMTYHNARIFLPPFLIILTILYRKILLKNIRVVLLIVLIVLTINLPYLPTWISTQGRARFYSESVINQPGNLLNNLQINYLSNYSIDYLFFNGDQNGRQSIKSMGELYLWSLPFSLVAMFFLAKKRSKVTLLLMSWLLLAGVAPAITRVSPHGLRGLLESLPWIVLSAMGIVLVPKVYQKLLLFLLIPCVVYLMIEYLHTYYFQYPRLYSADWDYGNKQAVQFIKKNLASYDQVFVHRTLDPTYFLFYLPLSPQSLQMSKHNLSSFGKFTYHDLYTQPVKTNPNKKSLIVAPAYVIPGDSVELRQIDLLSGSAKFGIYEF